MSESRSGMNRPDDLSIAGRELAAAKAALTEAEAAFARLEQRSKAESSGAEVAPTGSRESPVLPVTEGSATEPVLLNDIRRGTPRALLIAAIVGTLLVLINQGTHALSPSPFMGVRIALTFVTPFVVSMLGWLSATRADRRR